MDHHIHHFNNAIAATIALLMIFSAGNAQFDAGNSNYYDNPWSLEAGPSFGGMNCLTDLGGNSRRVNGLLKDLNIITTKPCGAIYFNAMHTERIGIRFEITKGSVTAYDSILKNNNSVSYPRYIRNLHFRSAITELSILLEWRPLSLLENSRPTPLTPYLLAGIAFFHFNPRAKLPDGLSPTGNDWVSLHELHTEGQGFSQYPESKTYSLSQFNFPLGLGLQYIYPRLIRVKLELVYRILMTDYLDDVSARYIDPVNFYDNLAPREAALAEAVFYRPRSGAGALPVPGDARGNTAARDAYLSVNLKIAFNLRFLR